MVKIEVIAHRDENVSGPRADRLGRQLGLQLQVELVHLHVSRATSVCAALGNGKYDKEQNREGAASHGGYRFGKKIDDGNDKEGQRDQAEADGNLHAANVKIKGHLKLAHPRPRVSKHEHGQPIHREAPDDAERVEVRKKSNVAATDKNGDDL